MSGAVRKALVTGTLLLATTALVTTGMAQAFDDPRNQSTEYYDAVNGAACYLHHEPQGFTAMGYGFQERFTQLPIGEEVPIKVVIRHTSQKVQAIQSISVVVNTSLAPNVVVVSNETIRDLEERVDGHVLTSDEPPLVRPFQVADRASEVYVSARLAGEPTGSGLPVYDDLPAEMKGELVVRVGPPEHRRTVEGPGPYAKALRLDAEAIRALGYGVWDLEVSWSSPYDETMPIDLFVAVNHTTDQTEFTFRTDEVLRFKGAKTTVEIPVVMKSAEEALLDFRIQSVSYWPHFATDGAPRDDGLFYRFLTMKVRGGDEAVSAKGAAAPGPGPPMVDLYNLFARLVGFLTLLLVPIAMVTGGLFGKGARRLLNRMTGGAKKRVLWHGAMSFLIIAVATLHFALAIVEVNFGWTKGLLWGGLGWVLLVSLGFTGYYQARMIKRWNYRVWRHTHLWSAVGVLAFGVLHMALDGSDLGALRGFLPWLNRLIWP